MISDDLDGPYDAEILMNNLLRAIPDAVAGIDVVESRSVQHSPTPVRGTEHGDGR